MVSVISHSHHQFNASVDAFTVHGIINRHIQTVLVRHVVLDYSAPCQTIVNQAMGPFANNMHISFPWLTAFGSVSCSWPWNWGRVSMTQDCDIYLTSHPLSLKARPKKYRFPPRAGCQHTSSTAIELEVPSLPTKHSLQLLEHFPGPQLIPDETVFMKFIPGHRHFRSQRPLWTLRFNLAHETHQVCYVVQNLRQPLG